MFFKSLFRTKSIDQILRDIEGDGAGHRLNKVLGVWDLTAFGVAAIVGAGIFSTIGNAAFYGGPAVMFLFIFTAIACTFSAFCYAEFASSLPASGSAYTYAYVSFGEILAWIIGWDLLMEYAISNIAVAISWSEYFVAILNGYGIRVPGYLCMDMLSAYRAFKSVSAQLLQGVGFEHLTEVGVSLAVQKGYLAWIEAPRFFGVPVICNLPALGVTGLVTAVAFLGMQESRLTSNLLVALKVGVILLVLTLGAFYVHPANWVPFAPNGVSGVFKGVSAVFFAYIGFDAISTTAEECKNPQRDLPRGMIYSLVICTVLYVLMSLVLTGMVSHKKLDVGDPLAFVFGPQGANLPWISGIVAVSAVVALFTVLLVYQLGQPRIWMAMSRDGLLPPIFSAVHPKYKTPWFSTLCTGVLVAVPSLFMNLTEVTDLTSTGTLFAFALVCGGALRTNPNGARQKTDERKKFRIPYINSKYLFPGLIVLGAFMLVFFNGEAVRGFFDFLTWEGSLSVRWRVLVHRLPMLAYLLGLLGLAYQSYKKNLSMIPVMGVATCTYLMTELGITNWLRFGIWLLAGFVVYFVYGHKHSRLGIQQ